jgi:glycosyltransferase involved in cell wall biosynthesis
MKIVFWQPMLSHLQSAHVRAIASRANISVTIVGLDELSAERRALGWDSADFGRATVIEPTSFQDVHEIIEASGRDATHVLAGWRGLRHGWRLLQVLQNRSARMGLLTEGGDTRGWRGLLRRVAYVKDQWLYGGGIDFILAIGEQGATWFRQAGYANWKIFPYAYITERPAPQPMIYGEAGPVELIYVGQYVPRKGMDIAFRALAQVANADWRLTVLGAGQSAAKWHEMVRKLGISDRVRFLSALPPQEVAAWIAESDLLLLPSRFDGWGAVVNEALMTGVPVVCSDHCGAKDLLLDPWRGQVVRANSVEDLRTTLSAWIARGKKTHASSERIRQWSHCIEGERGADYILAVIEHVYSGGPQPLVPWHIQAQASAGPGSESETGLCSQRPCDNRLSSRTGEVV